MPKMMQYYYRIFHDFFYTNQNSVYLIKNDIDNLKQ